LVYLATHPPRHSLLAAPRHSLLAAPERQTPDCPCAAASQPSIAASDEGAESMLIDSPEAPSSPSREVLRSPASSIRGFVPKRIKPKPPTSGDLARLSMYLTAQQHNKLKQHMQQVFQSLSADKPPSMPAHAPSCPYWPFDLKHAPGTDTLDCRWTGRLASRSYTHSTRRPLLEFNRVASRRNIVLGKRTSKVILTF